MWLQAGEDGLKRGPGRAASQGEMTEGRRGCQWPRDRKWGMGSRGQSKSRYRDDRVVAWGTGQELVVLS